MAEANNALIRQSLDLDFDDIKEITGWPDVMVNDYIYKQNNINSITNITDDVEEQVDNNTARIDALEPVVEQNITDININQGNIATNTSNIATNTSNIATNTSNIASVTNNFNTHNASNSQHGVTGENVGTEDFAEAAVGGVVFLADLVADVTQTSAEITTADIGTAPAAYDQTYAQEQTDLINELKATVNDLVTDTDDLVTQFNDLLQQMKDAKQMSET